MDIRDKRLVVIGGAGLIGSHTVDRLLAEDVGGVVIYDNFVRGREENVAGARAKPRVRVHDVGGDIMPIRHPQRRPEGCRRRVSLRDAVAAAVPPLSPCGLRCQRPGRLQRHRGLREQRRAAPRVILPRPRCTASDGGADDRGPPLQQHNYYGATKSAGSGAPATGGPCWSTITRGTTPASCAPSSSAKGPRSTAAPTLRWCCPRSNAGARAAYAASTACSPSPCETRGGASLPSRGIATASSR